jgi:hypothetical protein
LAADFLARPDLATTSELDTVQQSSALAFGSVGLSTAHECLLLRKRDGWNQNASTDGRKRETQNQAIGARAAA